mgnify:FL=1
MTIPNGIPEDSSQYYMNQPPTTHPYAYTEGAVSSAQPVGRQTLRSRMNMTPEISHSIMKDAVMMILGGLAGMGIFYAVTRSFDEPSGYAIFFGMGAGFPFGWRALAFLDPIFNSFGFKVWYKGEAPTFLMILTLVPLLLHIFKFGLAVMVGIPALLFSVARHLWHVFLD